MSDHPLRVHFVWTGSRFPYHARLAIESAIVAMPEARIDLDLVVGAAGDPSAADHFRTVAAYDRATVTRWTPGELFEHCPLGPAPYQALLGRLPARSPAAVSNLARLAILYTRGGVYLDTDVLVLRGLHRPSVHGSYVGVERVWDGNRSRIERGFGPIAALKATPWAVRWAACRVDSAVWHGRLRLADRISDDGHTREQVNNAVIGAPAESPFIAFALAQALEVDPSIRFALGPNLLDDVVRAEPRLACVAPASRFYAVPPGLSHRFFSDRTLELPVDAQVIHYVASNHRRLLADLDIDDPRFARETAPFWRRGEQVRTAIGALESPRRIWSVT